MKSALLSQYKASLQTIRIVIEKCPDEIWLSSAYKNKTWHICYHAMFYTNLYLSESENNVHVWSRSKPHYQYMSTTEWAPDYDPSEAIPYSKSELLAFSTFLEEQLYVVFSKSDFSEPSGFSWLPFTRFELYLYTLRHLQHHIGQIIERLSTNEGISIPWIGRGR